VEIFLKKHVFFLGALLCAQTALAAPTASPGTESTTSGTVTTNGQTIPYNAVAGTLVVHPQSWDDSTQVVRARINQPEDKKNADDIDPTASMFYVAYFKKGADPAKRPITFLYNGGPGSSSVWLHMGSLGPRRVQTLDDVHTPAAPYKLVNNPSSLLDVSDIVFIDAPGTGFGRIAGKDREKSFWGVDQDARAFANFITQFLDKYGRYNSPKYLFGESYGTTRSAVLVNDLQNQDNIDFNGVILLSQVLNYDDGIDAPADNTGIDQPYVLSLPTYAATAFYHKLLPQMPADQASFLKDVEQFASTDYLLALQQGADLPQTQRQAIAEKLHAYTGLPIPFILQADLRIDGGEFTKQLQLLQGRTTGRFDTRFSGPTVDPLSKEAAYDPQSTAISSAYVSAFGDYIRKTLKYDATQPYRTEIEVNWDDHHTNPVNNDKTDTINVMPDLALAMKTNPTLHVLLNMGYYDLATPYYAATFEMKHLPIPAELQKNIEYAHYQAGHMVYVSEPSLKQLHDNVADFIRRTDGQPN